MRAAGFALIRHALPVPNVDVLRHNMSEDIVGLCCALHVSRLLLIARHFPLKVDLTQVRHRQGGPLWPFLSECIAQGRRRFELPAAALLWTTPPVVDIARGQPGGSNDGIRFNIAFNAHSSAIQSSFVSQEKAEKTEEMSEKIEYKTKPPRGSFAFRVR